MKLQLLGQYIKNAENLEERDDKEKKICTEKDNKKP